MLKKVDNGVKVEPTPEDIVKAAFNNNLRKKSTLNQYVSQILRLHAHFFQGSEELKDLRWVKSDCAELIDFLKSISISCQHSMAIYLPS
jgi:hypothetical protein